MMIGETGLVSVLMCAVNGPIDGIDRQNRFEVSQAYRRFLCVMDNLYALSEEEWDKLARAAFSNMDPHAHQAAVHFAVRYAVPDLLRALLRFGPAYDLSLNDSVLKCMDWALLPEFCRHPADLVCVATTLVEYETVAARSILKGGTCPVASLRELARCVDRRVSGNDDGTALRQTQKKKSRAQITARRARALEHIMRNWRVQTRSERHLKASLARVIDSSPVPGEIGHVFRDLIMPLIASA